MLIRFAVTNFKSFKDTVEFNMLPGNQKTHEHHIYLEGGVEGLKMAAIYGANGSGKSNFVLAMSLMKTMIESGGIEVSSNMMTFRPAKDLATAPISFEIEFVMEETVYLYGFSYSGFMIVREWLYESGAGAKEDVLLFEREGTEEGQTLKLNEVFLRTPEDAVRIEFIKSEMLKPDRLFLSIANKLKDSFMEIKKPCFWLLNGLFIFSYGGHNYGSEKWIITRPELKHFSEEILKTMHTGVTALDVVEIPLWKYFGDNEIGQVDWIKNRLESGEEFVPLKSPDGRHEDIAVLDSKRNPVVLHLFCEHKDHANNTTSFSISEESEGTKRLINFAPVFYNLLKYKATYVVDEFDQSIHPALLHDLILKFSKDSGTQGQLVFTTHESNLLDQEIFRRDEIWFAEKKNDGATTMYPLSDFDIRVDLDIRKGYLNGRFGAIPFLGDLNKLNWNEHTAEKPGV